MHEDCRSECAAFDRFIKRGGGKTVADVGGTETDRVGHAASGEDEFVACDHFGFVEAAFDGVRVTVWVLVPSVKTI